MVARSGARIDAFVTDGVDVFMIEAQAARACSVASGTPDACREIVTGEQVGQRLIDLVAMVPEWDKWAGTKGPGKKGIIALPPLSPTAIALQGNRVFIADNQYEVVVACPSTGSCAGSEMGLVNADCDSDDEDPPSFGRSLAVAPAAVVWVQGDAIHGALIPSPGRVERPIATRRDGSTDETARIAAPGASDLLWLSDDGLHYAKDPGSPPERLFSKEAKDFSFDTERVYLAGSDGLFRVSRSDKKAALAASGRFEHVAVDAAGVYATMVDGGRTKVIEARAGKQLELAVVDGVIDGLAVAGDHVYFMTHVGNGSEIRRVAR